MTTVIFRDNKFYADTRMTSTLSDPHKCVTCGGKHVACDTQDKIYYRDLDQFKYLDHDLKGYAASGDMAMIGLINHLIRREDGRSFVHTLSAMAQSGMVDTMTSRPTSIMILTTESLFCYDIDNFVVKNQQIHKVRELREKNEQVVMGSGSSLAHFGTQFMGLNPIESIQFAALGDKFTGSGVVEVDFGNSYPRLERHPELQQHELVAKFLHDKKLISSVIQQPPTIQFTSPSGNAVESNANP